MTFHAPRPVASGKPYPVRRVGDRTPRDLADFVGLTSFVLDVDGEDYHVSGPGLEREEGVRVFEKDEQGHGKDIRVWTVRRAPEGDSFTAEHTVV